MQIGPILTSAPSIAWLREQLQLARADVLKVVPAWGLMSGWTPAVIAEVARLTPTLIVRTSWGDPSYLGGARRFPVAAEILAELRPWLAVRPDAIIEIGNEPLLFDEPSEQIAWEYRWHLERAIDACRAAFPQARLIAPAHIRNHAIRLGEHADGQGRWDAICADQLRRCDFLGLHAYSAQQAQAGILQLRDVVSRTLPIWLTEFALNEELEPAARGRRYREILDALPIAGAAIYHLDHAGGTDPLHFNPRYRLEPGTLAALALPQPAATRPPAPAAAPAPAPQPPAPAPAPAAPQRPPMTNIAMSRAHLIRGRAHGPISVLMLHATAGRGPHDLGWLRQGGSPTNPVSCHYYISKAGAITQLVADHDTAWHAGWSRWRGLEIEHRSRRPDGTVVVTPSVNAISLGIELENLNNGRDPYPAPQYNATVALSRFLVWQYGIERANLVRHLDTSPGRKTDPAGFPWARFVDDVYRGL